MPAPLSPRPIVAGPAWFTVITPNCIRAEYAPDGQFTDAPWLFAVNRAARFSGAQVTQGAAGVTIDTGAIRLRQAHH